MWSTSIGRFRETLSARDIAFLQLWTGRKMTCYDYYPEPLHLSYSSRLLFYFVDCPVNLTRMLLSNILGTFRRKIGQTPSARRLSLGRVAAL